MVRAGRSGDRIPVGARYFAPIRTASGVHPAPYTTGTGSFVLVKRPGRGVHNPLPSAEVKERAELYLYSPSGPTWRVLGWTLFMWNWLVKIWSEVEGKFCHKHGRRCQRNERRRKTRNYLRYLTLHPSCQSAQISNSREATRMKLLRPTIKLGTEICTK